MDNAYWIFETSTRADSTDDYTQVVSGGSPKHKRVDHVLVSEQFAIDRCTIWNGEFGDPNGFVASDHAPVVATIRIAKSP